MDNTRAGSLIPNELTDLILDIEKIKDKLNNQGKNVEIAFQYLNELMENKKKPICQESELA